ncbi:SGNH/GDSL hydrolase family protein [Candidatus Kaiserbacteria bacterium]|nr:SGNH/GDSL hydrolase family protein [Candidatus Kaiserbacteria bacterium]
MKKSIPTLSLIKNLGLICASVIITLILAEMAVRVFWQMDTGETWRMPAPHGQPYLVNIPQSKTFHRFQDFSTTYLINSLGNRGPEPGNEPVQVVFLGDSFTFGLFIDEQDTSVGQVRRISAESYGNGQVGVVNAAIAGSGIAEWIAYLQDYGRRLKPGIVVANLNYVSLSRSYKHPLFMLDCDREILLRSNPPIIDNGVPWPPFRKYDDQKISLKRWLNDHSQLFMTVRKGYSEVKKSIDGKKSSDSKVNSANTEKSTEDKMGSNSEEDAGKAWPNPPFESNAINQPELKCFVKASFKALRDSAKMAGGKLIVIDIGYRWQTKLARELSIDLVALDFVPKTLEELGIPYVNLTDQLYQMHQTGMQITIPGDGHPTKDGYLAIARGSWPAIKHQIDLLRTDKNVAGDN